jgi:hypothetical protein
MGLKMKTEAEQDAAYALLRCLWDWMRVDEHWEQHYQDCIDNKISRAEEKKATDHLLEEHTRPFCKRTVSEGFVPSDIQDIMTTFSLGNRRDGLIALEELVNDDYGSEIPF